MFYRRKDLECIPYQILKKLEKEVEAIERWLNLLTGEIIEICIPHEEREERQRNELSN